MSAAERLAEQFVAYLETGTAAGGLFTDDVFCDFSMPVWRVQAQGLKDVLALRKAGHPGSARVLRSRLDVTETGFVLEVEEHWEQDGEWWYCRELFRADVSEGSISELAVYCTGDWDRKRIEEHEQNVRLLRV